MNGNMGFAGVAGGAPGNHAEDHASYAQVNAPAVLQNCNAPCIAVEKWRGKWWALYQNTKTGQFWLRCSKRVEWHCELGEPPASCVQSCSCDGVRRPRGQRYICGLGARVSDV